MTKRIVSLLPSATEIVCRLGARDALVGVSHECDWPPDVVGLPRLTSARSISSGTSAEIHRSVVETVRGALSVYEVDLEGLKGLAPDVIVTQDLCDVCAVSLPDVIRAVSAMAGHLVDVVSLSPTRFADVIDDVWKVGRAIGRKDEAKTLVGELGRRTDWVRKTATIEPSRPRVLTIEWLDPVMLGGTWMPDLIEIAGGRPVGARAGENAPTMDLARLSRLRPDVVVVKPCGFTIERTLAEIDLLRTKLPWDGWPAVVRGAVFVVDGNAYFNRPGPRLVDSLEILASCVHPAPFAAFRRRYADAIVRVTPALEVLAVGG